MTQQADVAIVGAGVVGTAIARTLARYALDCVLVDAASDVGAGTSKANTAILHTGFDAKPGSLESGLLTRGSALLREYAAATGIPVERTGALLVAWTPEQEAALPGIAENARRNGYLAVRPVGAAELYAREPRLGPGALAGVMGRVTGGVFRPAGTIVPGASMVTNRAHAADQPSGVSGHRSSGSERGAPVTQMA